MTTITEKEADMDRKLLINAEIAMNHVRGESGRNY